MPRTPAPQAGTPKIPRAGAFAQSVLGCADWADLARLIAAEARRLTEAETAIAVLGVADPNDLVASGPDAAHAVTGVLPPGWVRQAAYGGQGFGWEEPSKAYLELAAEVPPRRRPLSDLTRQSRGADLAWLQVARTPGAGLVLPLGCVRPAAGVLIVLCPRARRWPETLNDRLWAFVELAGLACEAFRQRQQLEGRLQRSAAVSEIAQNITSTLEPDILLRLIMLETSKAVGCQAADIWLKEEKTQALVFQTSLGVGAAQRGRALGGGATALALSGGEPVLVADVSTMEEADSEALHQEQVLSLAAVPLKTKNKVLGVMHLFSRRRKTWGRDDTLQLKTLANQAAAAIENAQLFVETKRKAQELLGLYEVAQVISEMSNLQSALAQIVERVASILDVEKCWFMFWEERSKQLVAQRVAVGAVDEQLEALRFSADARGISPEVFRTARPFYTNTAEEEPEVQAEFKGVFRLKTLMAVPLRSREETLGVFLAANKKDGVPFTGNDVRLFRTLASEATVVIHNANLYDKLRRSYVSIVQVISDMVDARERYTRGHSERVAAFATEIAKRLGLTPAEVEGISIAGLLHDLGKIGVSENILLKPGRLDEAEYAQIKRHPVIGENILRKAEMPWNVLPMVRHHHERWDGKGYPDGLADMDIPLGARILAVADAFDVLTTDRVYQKARPLNEAFEELQRHVNAQFDARVVDALTAIWREGKLVMPAARPEETKEGTENGKG